MNELCKKKALQQKDRAKQRDNNDEQKMKDDWKDVELECSFVSVGTKEIVQIYPDNASDRKDGFDIREMKLSGFCVPIVFLFPPVVVVIVHLVVLPRSKHVQSVGETGGGALFAESQGKDMGYPDSNAGQFR